ncbi:Methyltransferase domain-containing protein [Seinonella peptonophila]|uniref:Methyltransferase domain-containing protein n=1 Tax=Seinonella peptonophila TaxID=112248 RepID=A0A1M4WDU0_9BACL|nr:methyltransferase domain-containing protein [Seinonella peptonophila]SHE79409.1 Methyltransferase domain-containing protein [Seinonella peptonophila]
MNKNQNIYVWDTQEAAEKWVQKKNERDRLLGTVTMHMIEQAKLRLDDHVLDIGAGTGDQTLLAAKSVGAQGKVTAIDISQSMISVVNQVMKSENVSNVETMVIDVAKLDVPEETFDAMIARMSLMFVDELEETLTKLYQILKGGRTLSALVWSKAEANPWIAPIMQVLRPEAVLDPLGRPGLFSLSEPDHVQRQFQLAGWEEIQIQKLSITQEYSSAESYVLNHIQTSSGPTAVAWAELNDQEQQNALKKLIEIYQQYETSAKLSLPGEVLLIVASKHG